MSKICQVCQGEFEDLLPIFSEDDKKQLLNLYDKIQWCYGLIIKEDQLSSMICQKCVEDYYSKKDPLKLELNNGYHEYLKSIGEGQNENKPIIIKNLGLKGDGEVIAKKLDTRRESNPECSPKKKFKKTFQCEKCCENFSDERLLVQHAKRSHGFYELYEGQPYSGLRYSGPSYMEMARHQCLPDPNNPVASTSKDKPSGEPVEKVDRSQGRIWKCAHCAFFGYTPDEVAEHQKVHRIQSN